MSVTSVGGGKDAEMLKSTVQSNTVEKYLPLGQIFPHFRLNGNQDFQLEIVK